ncbi:chromate efflux transporter [Chryseobacterium sp. NFX27]|uniref:chromate efflux transporter n=1 Tax=Chryseobacterium sp. NFX27 TaxID=2819618 RepID=UPI003CF195EE
MNRNNELKVLARVFTTLGVTAFGGPAAHIAMMQQEVVAKRKWMSEEHFLDLMGATNLIPGPNSTEMAMHIGQDRAGWRGLIVAGVCFIFPAVMITLFFAWLYKEYGQLPEVQPFIYGIKPAIISIILIAILPLAKKSLKNIQLGIIGATVLVLALVGVNEILLLFGTGLLAMALSWFSNRKTINSFLPLGILQVSDVNLFSAVNVSLFLTFLKIGSILYGSGYVLFAFLDAELVEKGLLTRQQLIDAIAVGQFTPGPVFSSVAFIGYQINGWQGAAVSTVGIFLPSFILVALLNPIVKMMRNSSLFSKFLDAVNIASVAIIISVCYVMAKESISDWRAVLIAVLCLILSFSFKKINSVWIVLLGSSLGYVLNLL